jgi:hypothetical protein
MRHSVDQFPFVAAFVSGSSGRWSDLQISEHDMLELCRTEDLSALCLHRLARSTADVDWPAGLVAALADIARLRVGEELLHGAETRAVVDALTGAGLSPILIKGTPLAYTMYDAPQLRPREDTDVLIAPAEVDAARRVLVSLGYSATPSCHGLFSQFEMQKVDRYGVCHVFDVHWKISTQPVFEGVLTHGELLPRTVRVPALGASAVTPRAIDALLLACVHPVMHHRGEQRALWLYDIDLLAGSLSEEQFAEFASLARSKQVAWICAQQLRRARALLGTSVPPQAMRDLSGAADEPSEAYLASHRTWRHEVASSIRALPRAADRVKLMREVLMPSPAYMLGAYGLQRNSLGTLLLPALYVHRNMMGAWKVLTGKK